MSHNPIFVIIGRGLMSPAIPSHFLGRRSFQLVFLQESVDSSLSPSLRYVLYRDCHYP